jgi:hypothetical protein
LARFYGWPPDVIDRLDAYEFATYFKGVEILMARETLENWTANDWPNIKKDKRESMHRKLHRVAYPDNKPIAMTPETLANFIGLGKM